MIQREREQFGPEAAGQPERRPRIREFRQPGGGPQDLEQPLINSAVNRHSIAGNPLMSDSDEPSLLPGRQRRFSAAPGEGQRDAEAPGMSIDELARQAQLPVRTVREYHTLRLLPPPERRGRVGVYEPAHL